jgi:hypothetical protein
VEVGQPVHVEKGVRHVALFEKAIVSKATAVFPTPTGPVMRRTGKDARLIIRAVAWAFANDAPIARQVISGSVCCSDR